MPGWAPWRGKSQRGSGHEPALLHRFKVELHYPLIFRLIIYKLFRVVIEHLMHVLHSEKISFIHNEHEWTW